MLREVSNVNPSEVSNGKSDSHRQQLRTGDRPKRPPKLPSMPEECSATEGGPEEPRPLLQWKGGKLVYPRSGRRSRLPKKAGEVLKPLEPSEDDGLELADDLAVVGIAITKFGKGWDLPPGIDADAECCEEDRLGDCGDGDPQSDGEDADETCSDPTSR
jgi:hypothetical protein